MHTKGEGGREDPLCGWLHLHPSLSNSQGSHRTTLTYAKDDCGLNTVPPSIHTANVVQDSKPWADDRAPNAIFAWLVSFWHQGYSQGFHIDSGPWRARLLPRFQDEPRATQNSENGPKKAMTIYNTRVYLYLSLYCGTKVCDRPPISSIQNFQSLEHPGGTCLWLTCIIFSRNDSSGSDSELESTLGAGPHQNFRHIRSCTWLSNSRMEPYVMSRIRAHNPGQRTMLSNSLSLLSEHNVFMI